MPSGAAALPQALPATRARPAARPSVKQRIRAIKNIGKITKAMKMVAASKMRNAQVAVENSRGIVGPFVRLFGDYPGASWAATERARPIVRLARTSEAQRVLRQRWRRHSSWWRCRGAV